MRRGRNVPQAADDLDYVSFHDFHEYATHCRRVEYHHSRNDYQRRKLEFYTFENLSSVVKSSRFTKKKDLQNKFKIRYPNHQCTTLTGNESRYKSENEQKRNNNRTISQSLESLPIKRLDLNKEVKNHYFDYKTEEVKTFNANINLNYGEENGIVFCDKYLDILNVNKKAIRCDLSHHSKTYYVSDINKLSYCKSQYKKTYDKEKIYTKSTECKTIENDNLSSIELTKIISNNCVNGNQKKIYYDSPNKTQSYQCRISDVTASTKSIILNHDVSFKGCFNKNDFLRKCNVKNSAKYDRESKRTNQCTENDLNRRCCFGSAARRTGISLWRFAWLVWIVITTVAALPAHKYSTRVVRTKYGPLRGIIVHAHPLVEAYLGVPYATPPLGSLRYMPPVTPSQWRTPRVADRFTAACPQRTPSLRSRGEALLEHPRARVSQLERLLPLLRNQSEDCLYVNLYVPRLGDDDDGTEETIPSGGSALPCLVYIHGESYSWNAGNPYDGTVLAARGKMIVVTINYRLGVLGFLKTGAKGSAQGNFGLMDLVAGLHWLRENLPAFGGDPERVTLMGHGTGAALANFLAVSPVAKDLLKRIILLSGSGLSSWALQRDPLAIKRKVAEQTGCHGDLLEEDLAPCLRNKPLAELLAVKLEPPRFLPEFAPFIDGTVLLNPSQASPPALNVGGGVAAVTTAAGYELADFPHVELMFGLTTVESYLDLNAQDLEFGFNETRRDRILRTYIRNAYFYHLNEIFSTLKNEYTDWDRPVQNPLNVRDGTLEVLSDGHTAAPLIRLGYLHALRGGKTYFAHFQHLSTDKDYPQRTGSVNGEDLPYFLGAPLSQSQHLQGHQTHAPHWPYPAHNYTQQDRAVSAMLIHYVANFVANGNPNPPKVSPETIQHENQPFQSGDSTSPETIPFWDTYDTINQLYLEIGEKSEMRSHYRGHKMSLWLSLIPQLHRSLPGDIPDMSMRHHHFQEEGANYYEGQVRPQLMKRPTLAQVPAASLPRGTAAPVPPPAPAPTTECPPNSTALKTTPAIPTTTRDDGLLRRLASSHYQSYTAALTVTIAVGCFLLLLNILIFAGIYHQRGTRNSRTRKNKDEMEANSCSSSSGENYETKTLNYDPQFGEKSGYGYGCKSSSYLMKPGSKYDLKTFSECGKPSFGEYSCYDEKNVSSQYEKRSLADISLCSLPDISNADGTVLEFQKSPAKRLDYGGSIVRIDTQKPDIQRINNQSIRSLENQTSSFHEGDARLNLNVNISSFCDPVNMTDSSTQVKFIPVVNDQISESPLEGEDSEACAEAGSSISEVQVTTKSVGAQSEPTTCDVGTNIDRSPSIPEPPPPPKGAPPSTGILRQAGQPGTSGNATVNPTSIMKKRVQIQEISV